MNRGIVLICIFAFGKGVAPAAEPELVVGLLPGQGADGLSFRRLNLPGYEFVVLPQFLPEKGETLEAYTAGIPNDGLCSSAGNFSYHF